MPAQAADPAVRPQNTWVGEAIVRAGDGACRVRYTHAPVGQRVGAYGGALPVTTSVPQKTIEIVQGAQGYTMMRDARVVASDIRLSRIVPLLNKEIMNDVAEADAGSGIVSGVLLSTKQLTLLVLGNPESGWDSLACALAERVSASVLSGAVRLGADAGTVQAIPFPIWLSEAYADEFTSSKSVTISESIHELAVGSPVRLVSVKGHVVDRALRVDAIVIVSCDEVLTGEAEQLSSADALPILWSHTLPATGDAAHIVNWIEGVNVFRVAVSPSMTSPMASAERLLAKLSE